MTLVRKLFSIHGDNIVECRRAFDYIIQALEGEVERIDGPDGSITCPAYTLKLNGTELVFRFLPGYGEQRWDQDVLSFIKTSGGNLREAADAIVTLHGSKGEVPIAAIEFCGALPAGNQAWQRQGRAYSFAHSQVPFFYLAELGGFELSEDRERKAARLPNPAVPFSFVAISKYRRAICLPVYEPNAGATAETVARFAPTFGKEAFLEFLKLAVLGGPTEKPVAELRDKCLLLVKLLTGQQKRRGGLTETQWQGAYDAVLAGQSVPDFLVNNAPLPWKKKISIGSITKTAKHFMALGAEHGIGLTSTELPLSLVPREQRRGFALAVASLYPDLSRNVRSWLEADGRHLGISWVNGFKPRGDDARPDRGLPPLARMLTGSDCDLVTFVYGPAPLLHWHELAANPLSLAERNGLWEAVFGVSDAVIADSSTRPLGTPRALLRSSWSSTTKKLEVALKVTPRVLAFGEQDVDTALHLAFASLGSSLVFEGLCNPPGGDWSGISFMWSSSGPEYRWLTLPRVSADGAKRPDHVFAVFAKESPTVCLCIESKETARSLDENIGPRLTRYAAALFSGRPSITRSDRSRPWEVNGKLWSCPETIFISAGAYLSSSGNPFAGSAPDRNLDLQIGVEFIGDGSTCKLHLRGDTHKGLALVRFLTSLRGWWDHAEIVPSN
jgi:hypothetical protein